jgi:DNA-binding HxlR family transcriptional regulator
MMTPDKPRKTAHSLNLSTPMEPEHINVTALPERHLPGDCTAVGSILSRIGDKWSVLVIMLIGDGPRRFNEIKRMVGGISQRMLTLTLRGLERDGLVTRTIYPTIPPRVDYELTELGHSLKERVKHLGSWAFEHLPQIQTARERFDKNANGV